MPALQMCCNDFHPPCIRHLHCSLQMLELPRLPARVSSAAGSTQYSEVRTAQSFAVRVLMFLLGNLICGT